ncbi:MAG: hypothetical protein ACLP50_22975, partial [Solirubrobacteraceae bacterium]
MTVIDHVPNIFSIAPGATGPGIERTPARLRDQRRPLLRTLRHQTPHPRQIAQPADPVALPTTAPAARPLLRAPNPLSDLPRR